MLALVGEPNQASFNPGNTDACPCLLTTTPCLRQKFLRPWNFKQVESEKLTLWSPMPQYRNQGNRKLPRRDWLMPNR